MTDNWFNPKRGIPLSDVLNARRRLANAAVPMMADMRYDEHMSPLDELHQALHWSFGDERARRGKWFVRLLDEDDLDGPVVIYCDDGRGGDITMPQDVYQEFRARGSPLTYTGIDVVCLPPTLAHLRKGLTK